MLCRVISPCRLGVGGGKLVEHVYCCIAIQARTQCAPALACELRLCHLANGGITADSCTVHAVALGVDGCERGRQWRWRTRHIAKNRSVVHSAQRHKAGVVGPRPTRGAAAELSAPPTCSRTLLDITTVSDIYLLVGIANSAPLPMLSGQRCMMDFCLV
jgi:hypothetical protein